VLEGLADEHAVERVLVEVGKTSELERRLLVERQGGQEVAFSHLGHELLRRSR